MDIQIPVTADPETEKRVVITRVRDLRAFEIAPSKASIPSLKDGRISDTAITSRAIARKRNSYGKALGDILLPEGQTVEEVVRATLVKALREKGYSVSPEDSAGPPDALPLEAEILQYWAWFTPGFWSAKLEFESILRINTPILREGAEDEVRGYVRLSTQAATGRAWTNTIMKGTEDLIANLKQEIRSPSEVAAVAIGEQDSSGGGHVSEYDMDAPGAERKFLGTSVSERLEQLESLRDEELINAEEYRDKREEILGDL